MNNTPTPHGVKDLVISCIDYRFRPKVAAWIKDELGDQADLVAVAGASKGLLELSSRDYILTQIEIGLKLHGIERVHVVDHIDCGAYGGSKLHANEDAETAFHASQCATAADTIRDKFPQLKVLSYALCFDHMVVCEPEMVHEKEHSHS